MNKRTTIKRNQTPEQIAYLAGIIDGEGCFYVGRFEKGNHCKGHSWHTYVKVTNCDLELIEWLEDIFGSKRATRYSWTKSKKYYRPVYTWSVTGELLEYICKITYPYLIIKRKQCETMVELRATFAYRGPIPVTEETLQTRNRLLCVMRTLNSRFHEHPLKNKSSALLPVS